MRTRPKRFIASLIAALTLLVSGLGPALAAPPAQATVTVRIAGSSFQPAEITIAPGTTVVWVQEDSAPHTTTSDAMVWDSGRLDMGQQFSRTFSSPGTFPYLCSFHPFMRGTVVVAGSTSTPTAAPQPTTTPVPMLTMTPPPGAMPSPMTAMIVQQMASLGNSLLLVITFDPRDSSDPWKLYDPSAPPFANDLTQLEAGRGYWVRVSAPGAISYGGNTYPLSTGYNLVGWRG